MMSTSGGARGVVTCPVSDMSHVSPVTTSLTPHIQTPHRSMTHRTPCSCAPTPVTPPRPVKITTTSSTARVDCGGLLVLSVHRGQETLTQDLQKSIVVKSWKYQLRFTVPCRTFDDKEELFKDDYECYWHFPNLVLDQHL